MSNRRSDKGRVLRVAASLWGLEPLPEKGVCLVKGCGKPAARSTNGNRQHSRLCFMHRQRVAVHQDPVGHQYYRLRKSARRRKIDFTLTKEEWRQWCAVTGYCNDRTQDRANLLSVDRIDSRGPYSLQNIRALTVSENSRRESIKPRVVRGRLFHATESAATEPRDALDDL